MLRGALIIAAVLSGLVTIACSAGNDDGPAPTKGEHGPTRTASVGGIDIEATWLGNDDEPRDGLAEYPRGRFLLLEVGMDTHSGDLGSIDLVRVARLNAGAGIVEPEAWIAASDDSHHRSGVLVFPRRDLFPPVSLTVALEDGVVELVWEEQPEV